MFRKQLGILILIILFIIGMTVGCAQNTEEQYPIDQKEDTTTSGDVKAYSTLLTTDYNGLNPEQLNQYTMAVVFDPQNKSAMIDQSVIYTNQEKVTLNEIYFHIYPNAYKRKETAPATLQDISAIYPNGFEPGYMDMLSVDIAGDKVMYSIEGKDETILKIPLKEPLNLGEKVQLDMSYKLILPPALDRFGYGEKTFNFGNWYPIAAVYDQDGWNLDPYYQVGDPFYSDTSNYDISITAPKKVVIATSGNVVAEETKEDNKTWHIEAKMMRDVAWVASEDFIIESKDVDGTLVKNYSLKDDETVNKAAAKVAYDAIETFNEIYGQYPYGQYSVVATSFPSGMEYPGLVYISEEIYNMNQYDWLKTVIIHETGHQWWYSVVGNDEIDEAWLDESLTTYSEIVFYEEADNAEDGAWYYDNWIKSSYERRQSKLQEMNADEVIVKPLDEFINWTDYGALTYKKGAMFLYEIQSLYGKETLYNILKVYFDDYRFLNATTEDFIRICEGVTGDSFDELTDKWLYNK